MLTKDIRAHKFDYSVLALMATIFLGYFINSLHSPSQTFLATVIFSLSYVLWGVWHHGKNKHLTASVVLEYFLVAVLAIVIVSTLLV